METSRWEQWKEWSKARSAPEAPQVAGWWRGTGCGDRPPSPPIHHAELFPNSFCPASLSDSVLHGLGPFHPSFTLCWVTRAIVRSWMLGVGRGPFHCLQFLEMVWRVWFPWHSRCELCFSFPGDSVIQSSSRFQVSWRWPRWVLWVFLCCVDGCWALGISYLHRKQWPSLLIVQRETLPHLMGSGWKQPEKWPHHSGQNLVFSLDPGGLGRSVTRQRPPRDPPHFLSRKMWT